jgi:hypothetical protein
MAWACPNLDTTPLIQGFAQHGQQHGGRFERRLRTCFYLKNLHPLTRFIKRGLGLLSYMYISLCLYLPLYGIYIYVYTFIKTQTKQQIYTEHI